MLARMISALLLAAVTATSALGQGKVVVYTSNDSNLNRFIFEAFKKETGVEVEQVEAGSGVILRRMASERERPLGDIIWGVSRTLLRANKALLAPYASKNKDAVPAHFRDPEDLWLGTNVHLLVILQNTKLLPGRQGPKSWADLTEAGMEGQGRLHRPGQFRLGLFQPSPCWRSCGAGRRRAGTRSRGCIANTKVLNRSSLGVPGRRQRRVSARHVARIRRLPVGLQRRAREGDLSGRRHHRADGRRRHHQGRPEHRERKAFVDYVVAQGRARGDPALRVPPAGAAGPRPVQAAGRDAAALRRQAHRLRRGCLGGEARARPPRRSRTSSAAPR